MKYHVVIEKPTHEDLEAITLWLTRHSKLAARRWYQQVRKAIETLAYSPLRCSLAPESNAFDEEIRQLFYGRRRYVYRILFTMCASQVHILHIRHGSWMPIEPGEEE